MTRFLFIADSLALDLANTLIRRRGREEDLLKTADDLEEWWTEASSRYRELEVPGRVDAADLDRATELRAMLREEFGAVSAGGQYSPTFASRLNALLLRSHPAISGTDPDYRIEIRATDSRDRLPVSIGHSAATLMIEGERNRLHRCEGCILLFYDRTKSATRRWCDTRCFDRARAQERRAASRSTAGRTAIS